MNEPFLMIQLAKDYPEFKLEVELAVCKGEFFSLVGPSGCGKTTLLRLIAGLETPDQGFIRLAGKTINGIPPAGRRVGMVFQDYALFPHLTVAQNIEYGLQVQRIAPQLRKKRVTELLCLFELETLVSRKIQQLSGGERQRVAIARALAPEPLVLLMDEPFSALDYGLRQRLQKDLQRIQKKLDLTVIFVTHQQEEALSLADHLGIMGNGKILQAGTPQEIYEKPVDEFVAEFLGEANLIPCHIEQMDERLQVIIGPDNILEIPCLPGVQSGNYSLVVRPEDLQPGIHQGPAIIAEITGFEYLGFTYRMEAICSGFSIKVLVGKNVAGLKTGMQIKLGIDPGTIRFISRSSKSVS